MTGRELRDDFSSFSPGRPEVGEGTAGGKGRRMKIDDWKMENEK
jgi:hypothetical protein